jgi:hypothetical protein
MPLIKNLTVDSDLCGDSFRRKEFALQNDYIRRYELGREVSIRTHTMKGAAVIEALRKVCEESVTINDDVLTAYADAEDWLCRKMQLLFQTVRHLGMNPRAMTKQVAAMYEASKFDPLIARGCDLIWIPVAAFYVGDERVYLFRVVGLNYQHNKDVMLNLTNTGVIGYTREYLNTVSPELAAYIGKLEAKAMEDENVKASFTRLGSILRPDAYKTEMIEERAKMYEKVDFGGWA